jgi:hypothetical protein
MLMSIDNYSLSVECTDRLCPLETWNALVDANTARIDSALLEDGGIASTALRTVDSINQVLASDTLPQEVNDGLQASVQQILSGLRKALDSTDQGRAFRFDMTRLRTACLDGSSVVETPTGCRRLCGSLAINEDERQDFWLPTAD